MKIELDISTATYKDLKLLMEHYDKLFGYKTDENEIIQFLIIRRTDEIINKV